MEGVNDFGGRGDLLEGGFHFSTGAGFGGKRCVSDQLGGVFPLDGVQMFGLLVGLLDLLASLAIPETVEWSGLKLHFACR